MSKKIKYGITGLVSLLVLFTLIIIAVPHFADANLFRSQIINAAQKATGRDVTINGNLQWAFFPAFSIEADQVTLANPAGFADKNALASIDQLKLSVEILPFILSKTVILDEVELKGANIHLITLANGQTNWQDLLTKPANTKNTANTATTNDTSKSSAVNFNVDKFLLENSQLTWDDQQQNQRWELSELNVSTHAFSLGSTFPLTISTKAQHPPSGQIFTLDLQTDANINP
jgi:AsmA protein